jgi:hypothetical protein
MSYVAYKERGTTENSDGSTKYAQWLIDQGATDVQATDDWCAIFVLWCAGHANVSYSVIPYYYGPNNMRDKLHQRGLFQSSYSSAVQQGDLIFLKGTSADPQHIGIVYAVSGSTITIVDGNHFETVAYRTLSLTDSTIVGYGLPNYPSSGHTSATNSSGVPYCVNCGYRISVQG